MKYARTLPIIVLLFCIPGIILCAMHFTYGFEAVSGLPAKESSWFLLSSVFFGIAGALLLLFAMPIRAYKKIPFETLFDGKNIVFQVLMVLSGMLMAIGGIFYLRTVLAEPIIKELPGGTRVLELVYAGVTIAVGICIIMLAKIQTRQITAGAAKLTLIPLLWSCIQLLVEYRITCIDPKLPSFAFFLAANILLVLSAYFFCALLFGKPKPHFFAWFSAGAILLAVSNFGGYGLASLMGNRAIEWGLKECLRGGFTLVAGISLFAELIILAKRKTITSEEGE